MYFRLTVVSPILLFRGAEIEFETSKAVIVRWYNSFGILQFQTMFPNRRFAEIKRRFILPKRRFGRIKRRFGKPNRIK